VDFHRFNQRVFQQNRPITTFRCVAEFGRYRGNIGLSAAERPEDLWVRGLEVLAAAVSAFFSDALMTP
jgi:hypothetical protein